MKNILIIGTLLLAVFIAVFRQRIFLRDPLAAVKRNGAFQTGYRVYINYNNDVLLENTDTGNRTLVEAWIKAPGVPKHLACFTALLCWTDADHAEIFPLANSSRRPPPSMTSREVTFQDETGGAMQIELR